MSVLLKVSYKLTTLSFVGNVCPYVTAPAVIPLKGPIVMPEGSVNKVGN